MAKKKFVIIFLSSFICLGASSSAIARYDNGKEKDYKTLANFIYRLTQNVELPSNKSEGFALCTISESSEDQVPAILLKIFTSKKSLIKVSVLSYSHVSEISNIKRCDFLYVSPSAQKDTDKIVDATHNLPVVTISNNVGFAKDGGVIGFAMQEGMDATLEINLSAAKKNNITINAQLLKVAQLL